MSSTPTPVAPVALKTNNHNDLNKLRDNSPPHTIRPT